MLLAKKTTFAFRLSTFALIFMLLRSIAKPPFIA
jgi:hypothetical protein